MNVTRFPIAYGWSASGFGTRYAAASTLLPTSAQQFDIDFAPASNAVAVSHYRSPYITVTGFSGSGFGTKYANPVPVPGSGATSVGANTVKFSPDGNYIACGTTTSPFVHVYPWSIASGFGTKLTNPATIPTTQVYNCAWGYTSTTVGFVAVTPGSALFVYNFAGSFGGGVPFTPSPAATGDGLTIAFGFQPATGASLTAEVGTFTLTGVATLNQYKNACNCRYF